MSVTLHEAEEALRQVEPETLREMGYQLARSHISICELTSRVGDCAHLAGDEVRDRVDALTGDQLATLLAPTAWMAADLHQRLGG
ncbi:MAG: hypothetical protein ACLFWM_02480 [Actinomycetota bacterium]